MKNIKINLGSSVTLILTIVLAVLKVAGVINISWWWVFCPIWLPFVIFIGLLLIFVGITALCLVCKILYSLKK